MISESKLEDSITGEFNAIRKYKKFAEVALDENLPNISYLFQGLIAGETIHLENHKRALGKSFEPKEEEFDVGTTLENLKAAFEGETYEYRDMYPSFRKAIKKEKKTELGKLADLSMRWALEVEVTHATTLKKALEMLEHEKSDFVGERIWVCEACGNLVIGEKPKEVCPVCKHDPMFYKEVER